MHGIIVRCKGDIFKLHLFSVTLHHHIELAVLIVAKLIGHIHSSENPHAVDLDYLVTHLQAGRLGHSVILKPRYSGGCDAVRPCGADTKDNISKHEIHYNACHHDKHSFWQAFITKRTAVLASVILALHGTIATYGKHTPSVKGIALFLFDNGRTHANSELVDLYSAGFRRNKVTKLVYYYDSFKDQYCK